MSNENGQWAQLCKDLGTKKGLDPMPPDQYLTYQDARYPNTLRLWSWVLSKTMRNKHRSAFCVDIFGRILQLKDAAEELHVTPQTISKTWAILENEGRVKRHGAKLFLVGDIKLTAGFAGEYLAKKVGTSEDFPKYISNQVNKLEQKAKTAFFARGKRLAELAAQLQADVVAVARDIIDSQYDALYSEFQLERRRMEPREKTPESIARRAKLEPLIRDYIQGSFEFCTKDSEIPTEDSSGLVQRIPEQAIIIDSSEVKTEDIFAGGRASVVNTPPIEQPAPPVEETRPPALPADFVQNLAARDLLPDGELAPAIYQQIEAAEMPLWFFFEKLDERRTRSKIGTGVLQKFTQGTIEKWRPLAAEAKERARKEAEQRQEQNERAARMAREILEDPNATEDEKQIAKQALAG